MLEPVLLSLSFSLNVNSHPRNSGTEMCLSSHCSRQIKKNFYLLHGSTNTCHRLLHQLLFARNEIRMHHFHRICRPPKQSGTTKISCPLQF